jgi:iron-sulfur cluster assembly accessory protein
MSKSLHLLRIASSRIVESGLSRSQLRLHRANVIPAATNAVQSVASIHSAAAVGASRHVSTISGNITTRTRPLHPQIMTNMNSKASFSSAAQEEEEPNTESSSQSSSSTTKTRKRPKRKDPIIITPNAAIRIKEILSSPNGEGALGIRLGVKRRGCNGLSYTLNYAFEKAPNEEVMEAHGVKVIIEPMALFSVIGTVMDWEETDMSSEFTFENPNSKGECGCGESFNV